MKRLFPLLVMFIFFGTTLAAQSPRIQVIHNSPDPLATHVDIWFDGTKIADNLQFRHASEFLTGASGNHIISICDSSSTDTVSAVAQFPVSLMMNTTYVVVADGLVNTTGYSPATPFDLKIYNLGRETANNSNEIDLLVHHGATDAPTVDIRTQDGNTVLVNDAAYGDFAGYLGLGDQDYIIRLTDATGNTTVQSYLAPLNTLGLSGNAITAVASGFLTPSANNNGPAFGIYVATANGGPMVMLPTVTSPPRVQIIHNSAGAGADSVDIYLDDIKVADNLNFRHATTFIDGLPGNRTVSVALPNSVDTVGAVARFAVNLAADKTYVVVADGLVSTTGYSPAEPFDLKIYNMARETANNPNEIDLLVHHGATDAPTVDIRTQDGNTILVNDAAYSDFAGYLGLGDQDYIIRLTDATGNTTVQSYLAPLNTLGLSGNAITAVASGFLNPSANNNGPAFGIYVATANGGPMVMLPAVTSPPRVQIIHNSAGAGADSVDIYLDDIKVADNLNFRHATAFIDGLPGNRTVSVALPNSVDTVGAVARFAVNLAADKTYVVVADGLVSTTGYSPAEPFDLKIYDMARETANNANEVDILVHHGATDAPIVDVRAQDTTTVLVNDAAYGDFAGYLSLSVLDYVIRITDATGNTVVQSYTAPLNGLSLGGSAITVVASGFLNPATNNNGPAFGLWVALASGGGLVELPVAATTNVENIQDNTVSTVKLYPNPTTDVLNVQLELADDAEVLLEVVDITGKNVQTQALGTLNAGTHNHTLDLQIPNGIYSLNIVTATGTNSKLIQVQR
ncbi:MAG: DUF4397 domain-containing protein [Aureispira sp.]|nr:DUF4397 domain-containing protein [Aureispira sp.]